MVSGRQDSNLRPPGPKPGAMTGLRYAPNETFISELLFRGCKSNKFIFFCKQSFQNEQKIFIKPDVFLIYRGESGIRTRGTVTRTSV